MDVIELTKKIITIPSYLDSSTNENAIGIYIFNYLKSSSDLNLLKQNVEGNRFNVIAYTTDCIKGKNFEVDTLFIDHIDTVQPKQGNKYNPFTAVEQNDKIYGLGACDTKANVAVLMKIAEKIKKGKYMFLFYVDEEYDFKGMRAFISSFSKKITIKRIISTDGEDMKIRIGCRGIIELDIECFGKTGHSANPANGINVVDMFYKSMEQFRQWLNSKPDINLGYSTLNVAYVQAGLNKGRKNNTVIVGRNGNNIPDFLESTLEVRTTDQISFEQIKTQLDEIFINNKVIWRVKRIRHNLKPWSTNKKNINFLINVLNQLKCPIKYSDPSKTGYVDLALLNEIYNVPSCCIGVTGANRHGANEWVDIKSIKDLEKILTLYIRDEN